MLLRYLDPRDTAEGARDGWIRTGDLGIVRGDLGYLDADHYLYFAGRIKDVILRGGYSVAAGEVERVLAEHPAVAEAAVVGVPDGDLGEEVGAAVVFKARHAAAREDLEAHVQARLATWKQPRLWRIVEALPRTSLGKVRRDVVAGLFDQEKHPGPTAH